MIAKISQLDILTWKMSSNPDMLYELNGWNTYQILCKKIQPYHVETHFEIKTSCMLEIL